MNYFVWLLSSRFLGGLGFQIFILSGIYQIYQKTGSLMMTGMTGLALFVPTALFNIFLGHWSDRFQHKARAYALLQFFIFASSLTLLTNMVKQSNTLLLTALIAYSAMKSARTPFYYTLMHIASEKTSQMTKGRLAQWSTFSWQGPVILGPLLFSFITIHTGKEFTSLLAVICFFLSLLTSFPLLKLKQTPLTKKQQRSSWRELIVANPIWLKASFIDLLVMGLLTFVSLMPFLLEKIHEDAGKLGYLRSAVSFGSFACVAIFEWPLLKKHRSIAFVTALIAACAVVLCIPFAKTFYSLLIGSFLFGLFDGFSILYRDFLLFSVPREMLGKASAVSQVLNSGSEDLGEFRAGSVAGLIGPGPALIASGLLAATLSVTYALVTQRLRPLSQNLESDVKMKGA